MARNGSLELPPSDLLSRQQHEGRGAPIPDSASLTGSHGRERYGDPEPAQYPDNYVVGSQVADADAEMPEISFLGKLVKLGCAIWLAEPTQPGEPDHAGTEFRRPPNWQNTQPAALERITEGFRSGSELFPNTPAFCANTGGAVVVVDVDTRNGGDIEKVADLLNELGVRIFAEVTTPSGGKHFYIAGHPDLPTVHSTAGNEKLAGFPGVDIQSYGANVFLPGTFRPKYGGAGYTIEFDHLDDLISLGDPEGAEGFATWVADRVAGRVRSTTSGTQRAEFQFDPAPAWDETPLDEREQKYLDAALAAEAKQVGEAQQGGRNDALNTAALKMGHYVAGAGLDQDRVIEELELAAIQCGLADDDGVESVHATIRSGLRAGVKTPRAVPPACEKVSTMSHQEFWEATTTLSHVRDFARARRVGPWGLLGVSLARVVTTVPPTVQLPPLVGGNASLNLFIGLIAESGSFKGATEQAAHEAFRMGPIYTTGVGSGEGINHIFAHYDKATRRTVMDQDRVMFSVPEIDTLSALGNRSGTTLLSQLRKAWSGEALTFGYADRAKAIDISRHGYRLTLVTGIQPGRGGDADRGLRWWHTAAVPLATHPGPRRTTKATTSPRTGRPQGHR